MPPVFKEGVLTTGLLGKSSICCDSYAIYDISWVVRLGWSFAFSVLMFCLPKQSRSCLEKALRSYIFFCLSSTEGYILLRLFFKNRCEILKIVYSGHGNVGSSQTKWHLANQVSKITNFQKVKPVVWVSPPLCHRNTLKTQAKKSGLLTPYMFS